MAYSAGFTPHPKVSYANAAPTGTGSEAEYLEIALTAERDPDTLRELLDESMPVGLDIIDAVEARTSGLADRLTASVWELRLDGVAPEDAERAVLAAGPAASVGERRLEGGAPEAAERGVAASTAAEGAEAQRRPKNGMRPFAPRPAVADLETLSPLADRPTDQACAILRLVV